MGCEANVVKFLEMNEPLYTVFGREHWNESLAIGIFWSGVAR
jgi:hypothetical protein